MADAQNTDPHGGLRIVLIGALVASVVALVLQVAREGFTPHGTWLPIALSGVFVAGIVLTLAARRTGPRRDNPDAD